MSMDVQGESAERDAEADGEATSTDHPASGGDTDRAPPDADQRNGVAVEFTDGSVADYAFVVRREGADWLYAERLVGDGDGFDDEVIETINAAEVRRIRSGDIHVDGAAAVHYGAGLLVDPEALLAECGLGP